MAENIASRGDIVEPGDTISVPGKGGRRSYRVAAVENGRMSLIPAAGFKRPSRKIDGTVWVTRKADGRVPPGHARRLSGGSLDL